MGLLIAAVGVLSACGNDDSAPSQDFEPRYTAPAGAERGGTLTVLSSSDIDSLDPGVTINQFGMMISQATQRTLLMLAPDAEHKLVPDLAREMPQVDYEGGTVTFRIRPGVRFSSPVDREVEAGDFKYAIERSLLPGVANGYVSSYLNGLVGFGRAQQAAISNPKKAPDIAGVTAPDDRTLELRFHGRVPPMAIAVLALPLGAPVPADYARPFDAEIPSTYDQHLVATGPYMVPNDASGKLTGYHPGVETEMVRNPDWDPDLDTRPAYLDKVEIESGYSNTAAASRKILSGEGLVNGDFVPDPPMLEYAATERPDQLDMVSAGAALYATLNTTIPPLDDPDVRRAILAATDREAIRLVRGGQIVGPLATHFIPPGVNGFEDAGGLEGSGFDFLGNPHGNASLAAEYMKRAGFPDGKYEGDAELNMVSDSTAVGRRVAELVRQAIDSLGIPVRVRAVARDVMYSRYCNVPRAEVAICPNVGWLSLLGDPQTVLAEAFSGDAIRQVNNSNWSQLDDPKINRQIRRAQWIVDPAGRAEAWGSIDREITGLAPAIPLVWSKVPFVFSTDVDLVIDRTTASPSLALTSLAGGGD
ncbi:MAG: hypothetical protein J0H98_05470 [Solirubrobacterales bacterium]|nr:hypothetical protein [Solirubrobacterales bacterium]